MRKATQELEQAATKKAGQEVEQAGAKKATAEAEEAGAKKATAEGEQAGAKKAAGEAEEAGAKKAAGEAEEAGVKKATTEAEEAGSKKAGQEAEENAGKKAGKGEPDMAEKQRAEMLAIGEASLLEARGLGPEAIRLALIASFKAMFRWIKDFEVEYRSGGADLFMIASRRFIKRVDPSGKVPKGLKEKIQRLPEEEQRQIIEAVEHIREGTIPPFNPAKFGDHRFFNRDLNPFIPQHGIYAEYYVRPGPGMAGAGTRRIVVNAQGHAYYTNDHYDFFIKLGKLL